MSFFSDNFYRFDIKLNIPRLLQCLEVLEDNEDDVLKLLMSEKISENIDIDLCTTAAKYCDDVLPEADYVLEEHEEL